MGVYEDLLKRKKIIEDEQGNVVVNAVVDKNVRNKLNDVSYQPEQENNSNFSDFVSNIGNAFTTSAKKTLTDRLKDNTVFASKTSNDNISLLDKVSNEFVNNFINSLTKKQETQQKNNSIWQDIVDTASLTATGAESGVLQTLKYVENANENNFSNYKGLKERQFLTSNKVSEEDKSKAKLQNTLLFNNTGEKIETNLTKKAFQDEIQTNNEEIEEKQSRINNKALQKIGELAPSIGQMAVGAGLNAINPIAGASYFFSSSAGSYIDDAKQRGMDDKQAFLYGNIMGAVEAGTEEIGLNNFSKAGKAIKGIFSVAENTAKEAGTNVIKSALKDYGLGIANNFIQEAIVDPIQEVVATGVAGKNKANWEDMGNKMLQDGINGALTSAIVGGADLGINSCIGISNKINNGEKITKKEFQTAVQDASTQLDTQKMIQEGIQQQIGKFSQSSQSKLTQNEQINDNRQITQVQDKIVQTENTEQINNNSNFIQTAKNYNLNTDNETIKSVDEALRQRGITGTFDDSLFKDSNQNAIWKNFTDENGNIQREIIINPNGDSTKTLQNITIHEFTHDFEGTKEYDALKQIVLDYDKGKKGYEDARKSLAGAYSKVYDSSSKNFNNLIENEAVADILGSKLGDQEFVNHLTNQNNTVGQKIYTWVVDKLNKINKLTGYKNEKLYWADVKNKFEQAFNSNVQDSNSQTRYSMQDNENNLTKKQKDRINELNNSEKFLNKKNIVPIENNEIIETNKKISYSEKQNIEDEIKSIKSGFNSVEEYRKKQKDITQNKYNKEINQAENSYLNSITKKGNDLFYGDGEEVTYNSNSAIEAIVRKAKKDFGAEEVYHSSKHGSKYDSSVYLKVGDNEVRISNHDLPEVMHRTDSNYKTRWNEEIVLNNGEIKNLTNMNEKEFNSYLMDKFGISKKNSDKSSFSLPKNIYNYEIKSIQERYKNEDKSKILEDREELEKQLSNENYESYYDTNIKLKAIDSGFDNIHDYLVDKDIKSLNREYNKNPEYYNNKYKKIFEKEIIENKKIENLNKEIEEASPFKRKQFEITQKTNPMFNEGAVGIRSPKDIKTFDEVIDDADSFTWGDFTREEAKKALKSGKITIYSSYPIKQGVFVSTSRIQSEEYAGGKNVYSRTVPLNNVAWINGDEGQYANTKTKYSLTESNEWQNRLDTLYKNNGNGKTIQQLKLKSESQTNSIPIHDYSKEIENKINSSKIITDNDKELLLKDLKDYDLTDKETYKNMQDILKQMEQEQIKLNNNSQSYKDNLTKMIENSGMDKEDKKFFNHYVDNINIDTETYNEIKSNIKEVVKTGENTILDTTRDFNNGRKEIYGKYMKENSKYDNTILKDIIDFSKSNSQGRRTKEQWLGIAKQLGMQIANKSNKEIEQIAYRTWQDTRPNMKENLNRQGQKFVKFNSDDWINEIYNSVKESRSNIKYDDLILNKKTNIQNENKIEEELPIKSNINNINDVDRPNLKDNNKIRKHYTSIIDSNQIGQIGKQSAKSLLGKDTYVPQSNNKTLETVNSNIEKNGSDKVLETFNNKIKSNERLTLNDIATGERLIQIYSQNGDYKTVNDLIQNVAMIGSELGQQVQAMSLIKRASPEGQLQYLTKTIDRMNNDFVNNKKNNPPKLNLTDEMSKKILSSKNKEELENNIDSVKEELAKQLPATIGEQIDEWRYLAMLGNPKTHIRNMIANTAMQLTKGLKDRTAGVIEDTVAIFNKDMERTKTLKPATKEIKQFVKEDSNNMKERLTTGGKYDIKTEILQKKDSFNNKLLNATVGKLAKWNSDLLEGEDWIALKPAYEKAMANYLTSNNITTDYLKSGTKEANTNLEKARNYAIEQAQEVTFRQYNSLANTLNQASRNNKVTKKVLDAVLPFKKTPLNIAKEGFEYSPLGLLKSITVDTKRLNQGKININQYIDNISKGLTGTAAISVLGYSLASMGVIKGGAGDDKDDKFEQDQGNQNYSIKIGDKTYTIDWLSPSAMPLFVGVEIYNNINSKNKEAKERSDSNTFGSKVLKSTETLANSLATTMDPMADMSMLSGLTSLLKSYSQGSSYMVGDILENGAKSYVNQFVPTALGQVAKITDDKVRSTTSTEQGLLSRRIDSTKLQIMSKIPGLSEKLPIKTDVWGKEQTRNSNIPIRVLEESIFPWNKREITTNNKVNDEVLSLYDKTGNAQVVPSTSINKDFVIDGNTYRMTDDEYAKYKKSFGEKSYKLLNDLISSKDYSDMTDEQKQKAITEVYSYANESNKVSYAQDNKKQYDATSTYKTVKAIEDQKGKASEYFDYVGKTIGMEKESEKRKVLVDSTYSDTTKKAIYINTIGKDDDLYNNIMSKSSITINDYLNYKSQVFKADKDKDGKTITNSRKNKLLNYVQGMHTDINNMRLLMATEYKLSKNDANSVANYVQSLKITTEEKTSIFKKLKGFKVNDNGTITY